MAPFAATIRVLLLAVCLALGIGPAVAQLPGADRHVETRLVAAVDAVGQDGVVPLGLQFRMQPGWKIYWRSPGDAGYPPEADWTGSDNLQSVETDWPAPHRFSLFGLETMGYADEVVLPLSVRLDRPGEPLSLRGRVAYLACNEICIPYEDTVALDLPAGSATPSDAANLIARYADRVPGDGVRHGLAIERVRLTAGMEGEAALTVEARALEPFTAPDLFVEAPDGAYFGAPEVRLAEGGRRATLTLTGAVPAGDAPGADAAMPLTLTLVDSGRGMEVAAAVHSGESVLLDGVRNPVADAAAAAGSSPALIMILGLALLGGLVLNLMPCVLPVLSIKLLGVLGQAGAAPAAVRLGFLATAAGVLVSVLALALALIALKAAGAAVGWGIQFQQPLFLIALIAVLTLFACNLAGLFTVRLPQRLADAAGGPVHTGRASGLAAHFLTGAFATLLATPCTAPFLGTAVGFALARGPAEILMVFTALGVGLAAPYLLVAAAPRLVAILPRPGPWMTVLRWVMAAALAVTALWLLAVLAAQIGTQQAVAIGAAMLLIAGVLAARRLPESRLGRNAPYAVALLIVAALALPLVRAPAGPATPPAGAAAELWQPFDAAVIPALVASGSRVLVDVTADWCLTCKVNKSLVLDREPVAGWIADGALVAMRADWTRPDPAIAAYLARFGRYGIPFNAVYGPDAPEGVVLPELLTADAVAAALAAAGGQRHLAER